MTLPANDDRIVHARFRTGLEVVRYDRAGRWYFEKEGDKRQRVTIQQAVTLVRRGLAEREPTVEVFPGRPGGGAFDRKVGLA